MRDDKGFSLIEIVITLSISAILIGSIVAIAPSFISHITQKDYASNLYQDVQLTRMQAMTYDQDTTIRPTPPSGITVVINNKNGIGFKPNGNTKYSGTISINGEPKITVAVGNGKITMQ